MWQKKKKSFKESCWLSNMHLYIWCYLTPKLLKFYIEKKQQQTTVVNLAKKQQKIH